MKFPSSRNHVRDIVPVDASILQQEERTFVKIYEHIVQHYIDRNSSCTASALTTTQANFRIHVRRCWSPLSAFRSKFTSDLSSCLQFLSSFRAFSPYLALFLCNFFAIMSVVTLQVTLTGAISVVVIIYNSSCAWLNFSFEISDLLAVKRTIKCRYNRQVFVIDRISDAVNFLIIDISWSAYYTYHINYNFN